MFPIKDISEYQTDGSVRFIIPWAAVERHTLRRPCPGSWARVCAAERWGRAGWSVCAFDASRWENSLRFDPTGTNAVERSRPAVCSPPPPLPRQPPPGPAAAPWARTSPSADVRGQRIICRTLGTCLMLNMNVFVCVISEGMCVWPSQRHCFLGFLSPRRCCSRVWVEFWSSRSLQTPELHAVPRVTLYLPPHPPWESLGGQRSAPRAAGPAGQSGGLG